MNVTRFIGIIGRSQFLDFIENVSPDHLFLPLGQPFGCFGRFVSSHFVEQIGGAV